VTYTLSGGWPGNFQADVTVTNTGSTSINGWSVGWTYTGDQDLYNWWGADISQSGQSVTADNASYNAIIPAGQSIVFGIQGTVSGTNAVPSPISCTS
jgi:endoglucanase